MLVVVCLVFIIHSHKHNFVYLFIFVLFLSYLHFVHLLSSVVRSFIISIYTIILCILRSATHWCSLSLPSMHNIKHIKCKYTFNVCRFVYFILFFFCQFGIIFDVLQLRFHLCRFSVGQPKRKSRPKKNRNVQFNVFIWYISIWPLP